jgi:hypothetical protein
VAPSTPAAFTAGRHTSENRARRIGSPLFVREDEAVGTGREHGEVRRQRVECHLWKWNDPMRCRGLRFGELWPFSRHEHELAVDPHLSPQEVHPVDGEPETLPLP